MKKRVLSALLALCMACGLVSTVWAEGTDATSGAPEPASQTLNLDNEQSGNESGADSTSVSSDSSDSTSASSGSTSSSSSAASDATSDATSGEGDESATSSDSTAASDSTSSSSSASSDSDGDAQDTTSSDVTGDESGTGTEEESEPAVEQPGAGNSIIVTENSGDVPTVLADGVETYANTNEDGTLTYNGYQLFHGEDTASQGITINVFDYDTVILESNDRESSPINFDGSSRRPFLFLYDPGSENSSMGNYNRNAYTDGVRSNIVGTELVGGYPQLAGNGGGLTNSNRSLAYLFDPDQEVSGKTTYANANYLFQKDEQGYYYFDSETNFATLIPKADDEEGNNFWLYPNASNVWVYNYSNGRQTTNQVPQFMPFNTIASGGDQYDQGNGHTGNYHFGMTVEFDFLLPENGELEDGSDMTFEFTGDDDVWVYIDGQRVLDLGGIHPSQSGTINFATGEVRVNNQRIGYVWDLVGMTEEEWNATEYQTHNLKFFYLERGAGGSNCQLRFNMPTVPSNSVAVTKRVTGDAPENAPESYTMQFVPQGNYADWENISSEEPIKVGTSLDTAQTLTSTSATFTVPAGDTVYIYNVPADMPFTIQELGVQAGVNVSFSGGTGSTTSDGTNPIISHEYQEGTRAVTVTNEYPMEPVTPGHLKYIEKNEDGSYDLTLNVTGAVDTTQGEAQKVDILYVLDNSTSMDEFVSNSDRTVRLTAAKNAITALETALSTDGIDVQHAMVIFSSEDYTDTGEWWNPFDDEDVNNTYTYQTWTSDPLNLTAISTTNHANGTNYQAGIQEAKTVLQQGTRDDAIQVVIFVSDGEPNRPSDNALSAAQTEIRDLNADRLYAIGVSNEVGLDTLTSLIGSATNIPSENKSAYSSSNSAQLAEIFRGLAAEILSADVSNVTITDTLSQYAQLTENATFTVNVEGADGITISPRSFTIAHAREGASGTISYTRDGESVSVGFTVTYTPAVEATATTEAVPASFSLDFDDNYVLELGWTYSITTQIEPTEAAYDYYRENNNTYPADMIGEADTDAPGVAEENYISEGKAGFFSNQSAILTYNSADQTVQVDYNNPVIQVPEPTTGDLTIVKDIYGLNDEQVIKLVDGTYRAYRYEDREEDGLRFDVDVFNDTGTQTAEERLILDEIANNSDDNTTYNDSDWTFNVVDTLDDNEFQDGVWGMQITPNQTNESVYGQTGEAEHFTNATLTKVEEGHYQYVVTIKDVTLDSWYRVWEMHMDVPGFTLTSSVDAKTTAEEESLSNYLTEYEEKDGEGDINDHGGRAFAFEMTEDTTVHFTNTYLQGELEITKRLADVEDQTSSSETFTFTVSIPAEWAQKDEYNDGIYPVTYSREGSDVKHTDGTLNFTVVDTNPDDEIEPTEATATLELYPGETATIKLPTGITPTVTEAENSEYTVSWTKGTGTTATEGNSVTADAISTETPSSVTCINTPKFKTLTVNKTVTGAMGNKDEDFTFTLTLSNISPVPESLDVQYDSDRGTSSISKASDENTYTFLLTDGETVQISIPYDATALVTETEANGYDVRNRVDHKADNEADFGDDGEPIANRYTDSNSTGNIEMDDDHSVEFVNYRDVVAPTGLESNHTVPYTVMVSAAGIAGLALLGSMVARRRRQRQE